MTINSNEPLSNEEIEARVSALNAADKKAAPVEEQGEPWGFIERGKFVEVPKIPLTLAGYKNPPFTMVLPHTGEKRFIDVKSAQLKRLANA